jgi:hypothetical protein
VACACLAAPLAAAAQATASLEIRVLATPTGGRPEKVMQHAFYLVREKLATIEEQARQDTPAPDLAAFVDSLKVSPELKEWMKKNKTVAVQGADFVASLTVDDVMSTPEFRAAYATRNQTMVGLGFPERKAKLTDREKNPARWEASEKRYWSEVRSYLILHPESKQGMDEHLLEINAVPGWKSRQARHEQEVRQRALQLVHGRYLVAQAETDLEGVARFTGVPAGRYWLTNLWSEARAGDVRLQWEVPVVLGAGQSLFLELSNANARLP